MQTNQLKQIGSVLNSVGWFVPPYAVWDSYFDISGLNRKLWQFSYLKYPQRYPQETLVLNSSCLLSGQPYDI
jgi:hypothetical protein